MGPRITRGDDDAGSGLPKTPAGQAIPSSCRRSILPAGGRLSLGIVIVVGVCAVISVVLVLVSGK